MDLPIEILEQEILPYLSIRDIITFTSTLRHNLSDSCWKTIIQVHYNILYDGPYWKEMIIVKNIVQRYPGSEEDESQPYESLLDKVIAIASYKTKNSDLITVRIGNMVAKMSEEKARELFEQAAVALYPEINECVEKDYRLLETVNILAYYKDPRVTMLDDPICQILAIGVI